MRFGISTFVTDEGIAPRALARAIEEGGFDSLFIAEHTHIPLSRKSPGPAAESCRAGTTGPSTLSSPSPPLPLQPNACCSVRG